MTRLLLILISSFVIYSCSNTLVEHDDSLLINKTLDEFLKKDVGADPDN